MYFPFDILKGRVLQNEAGIPRWMAYVDYQYHARNKDMDMVQDQ